MKPNNEIKIYSKSSRDKATYKPIITKSDLELGEALLKHIAKFKSPIREQEFVKFIFAWNQETQKQVA